jgi:hypothetical protein
VLLVGRNLLTNGRGRWLADYGNETSNHFDHVHIATDGGGYPAGKETYYI